MNSVKSCKFSTLIDFEGIEICTAMVFLFGIVSDNSYINKY